MIVGAILTVTSLAAVIHVVIGHLNSISFTFKLNQGGKSKPLYLQIRIDEFDLSLLKMAGVTGG